MMMRSQHNSNMNLSSLDNNNTNALKLSSLKLSTSTESLLVLDSDITTTNSNDTNSTNNIYNDFSNSTLVGNSKTNTHLDFQLVQNNLYQVFSDIFPPAFNIYDKQCQLYISQLCAYLTIYSTSVNPNTPTDIDYNLLWKYAVAMTDFKDFSECISTYLPIIIPSNKKTSTLTSENNDNVVSSMEHKNDDNNTTNDDDDDNNLEVKKQYEKIVHDCRIGVLGSVPDSQTETEDDAADTSLCNIEFSLAFGGKILLQNTFLKLGNNYLHVFFIDNF
jgi:hypothetical protein